MAEMKALTWARNLAARLRGKPQAARMAGATRQSADPVFSALDPTIGLFGEADKNDERFEAQPFAAMSESDDTLNAGKAALEAQKDKLVRRIEARTKGAITMRAQILRLVIAAAWLGAGAWLYSHSGASADAKAFLIVGAAGAGAALLVAGLLAVNGKAGNNAVRREAETMGRLIADAAEDADFNLNRLNSGRARSAAALNYAQETSRGAKSYFGALSFLNDQSDANAFGAFLSPASKSSSALPSFLIGAVAGAALLLLLFAPKPGFTLATPGFLQDPLAAGLLFGGALLYAAAGLLSALFRSKTEAAAAASAQAGALASLRSAYAASEAPAPGDIIRRAGEAAAFARSAVNGETETNHFSDDKQDDSRFSADEAGEPHWRRRNSSVKFVDTGFQAAPASWRTDAYQENFSRKPVAKRDLKGLDKGSRD